MAMKDDCIDLTDDATPPSDETEAGEMKKARIMQFAASINPSNGLLQSSLPHIKPRTPKRGRTTPCPGVHGRPVPEEILLISDEDTDMDSQSQRPSKRQALQQDLERAQQDHARSMAAAAWTSTSSQQQQDERHANQDSNHLLADLARQREQRRLQQQQQQVGPGTSFPNGQDQHRGGSLPHHSASAAGSDRSNSQLVATASGRPAEVSILTYNVWFKEEVALEQRMHGLAAVIEECGFPDFLLLQEVTHNILQLWTSMPWWHRYASNVPPAPQQSYFTVLCAKRETVVLESPPASIPFPSSQMARGLLYSKVQVHGWPLLVATTHLESPMPSTSLYTEERRTQQRQAVGMLNTMAGTRDVLLAGDLNWTDERDGPVHLDPGWQDAWQNMRAGEPGFTYDTAANPMLTNGGWRGGRLDRVLCRLGNAFEPRSIEMVGRQRLVGVTHLSNKGKLLPVLPSDHFGLLLKMQLKAGLQARAQATTVHPGAAGGSAMGGPNSLVPFSGSGRMLGGA